LEEPSNVVENFFYVWKGQIFKAEGSNLVSVDQSSVQLSTNEMNFPLSCNILIAFLDEGFLVVL
jgi:hypothetical protein